MKSRPVDVDAQRSGFVARFRRRPLAVAALSALAVIVLLCLAAPWIAPYDPLHQDLIHALQGPSGQHWLGTDTYGRDVLSRLLYGGRAAFESAVIAIVVMALIGPSLGLIAGFVGGRWDAVISAVVSGMLSLPAIVILLAVLAVFPDSMTAAMVALGVLGSAPTARVIRGATIGVRNELYIDAARVAGLSTPKILTRHVLPRTAGAVVVQITLFACLALSVQGGLAFLGAGVQEPRPSWGGGIGEAQQVIFQTQWLVVPYGGALALTILLLGVLGDQIRDVSVERWSSGTDGRRAARASRAPAAEPASRVVHQPSAGTAPDDAVLWAHGLTVSYAGKPAALRNFDVAIRRGEIVGIVGESGSGKTTAMLALLGLLPGAATIDSGQVRLQSLDLLNCDARSLRQMRGRQVAMISQSPMSALDPVRTVGGLVDEIVRRHHPGERKPRSHTLDLLRRVQIPDAEGVCAKYPFELSGGMAQRVCIAMALAGPPAVLVADEPTTALDVTVQAEILDLLRQIRDETGMAILLVTHNLGIVADICERVVVMRDGVTVEAVEVEELFANPRDPYVKALIAATPDLLESKGVTAQ